jgi:uncharacterized protein YdeI (YjbR/CyaY-like superfamily)
MQKASSTTQPKKSESKKNKASVKKVSQAKKSDAEKVDDYMKGFTHPLKAEMEVVRNIIRRTDRELAERIKWNAPSYHYKNVDLVTFNGWAKDKVHLVFHHPHIVKIRSTILEGEYPTRRMIYFNNMKEIKANKKELERILGELIKTLEAGKGEKANPAKGK